MKNNEEIRNSQKATTGKILLSIDTETALTNQYSIQEEIKGRLKSRNACYCSEQYRLSSSLLSKNINIKIYRTIIFPVVLYGCENWSLTMREKRRLRVFQNWVLMRIFGPKRDEVTREGENYIMRSCTADLFSSPNIFRVIKSRLMRWAGHAAYMGRGEEYAGFWGGNLRERHPLEGPGLDGRIIFRWIFMKWDVGAWTRPIWVRIGTGGGHL
jgi:hypothetical protein